MSKLRDTVNGVKTFSDEVVGEVRKSTWPTRQELTESTIVVVAALLLLAGFTWIFDVVLVKLLRVFGIIPPG